jgi:hypothetical protein
MGNNPDSGKFQHHCYSTIAATAYTGGPRILDILPCSTPCSGAVSCCRHTPPFGLLLLLMPLLMPLPLPLPLPLLMLLFQNLSKEDIFKANTLGWCIEWVSHAPRQLQQLRSNSDTVAPP